MIRKTTKRYLVTGSEFISLCITTPGGEVVQVTVQTGSRDKNGREYVSIGALFNQQATVEFRNDPPQCANIVVCLPKASVKEKSAADSITKAAPRWR